MDSGSRILRKANGLWVYSSEKVKWILGLDSERCEWIVGLRV